MAETFVILGASDKEERYSYKALMLLQEHGFKVIPIHPKLRNIANIPVFESLDKVNEEVHTITMYVGPQISQDLVSSLIRLKPQRIIFNPGSENPAIYESLRANGIEILEACTLVMLKTGQI